MNTFSRSMKPTLDELGAEYALSPEGRVIAVVFQHIQQAVDFECHCTNPILWRDPIPAGIPCHRNKHVIFFEER